MRLLLVAMLFTLGGAARACDPVLLELIRGRAQVSAFDSAVEAISTKMNDIAAAGRSNEWEKGLRLLAEVERDWVGVYGKYYLGQPSGQAEQKEWQATFDFVTKTLAELEELYELRDFDKMHPHVRLVQDRLVRFYEVREPDTPKKMFARVRGLSNSLRERAMQGGHDAADLGETWLYLDQAVRKLPEMAGPSRTALMETMKAAKKAVVDRKDVPAAAAAVTAALDRYREETLEKLWFGQPPSGATTQERKE